MAKKISLIIIGIIIILICIFFYIENSHWSVQKIDDKTIRPLPTTVMRIKDGLKYATLRAKQWRKDAILTYINVSFDNIDAIKTKKGVIDYRYYVKNKSFFGFPDVVCWISIDLDKQAITRFEAYGGENLIGRLPLDYSKWDIDIVDILNENPGNPVFISMKKYKNPRVLIRALQDVWEIAIFPSLEKRIEEVTVYVDVSTKKVIRIEKLNSSELRNKHKTDSIE